MGLENPSGAVREWSGLTWQEEEGRFVLGYWGDLCWPREVYTCSPPSISTWKRGEHGFPSWSFPCFCTEGVASFLSHISMNLFISDFTLSSCSPVKFTNPYSRVCKKGKMPICAPICCLHCICHWLRAVSIFNYFNNMHNENQCMRIRTLQGAAT